MRKIIFSFIAVFAVFVGGSITFAQEAVNVITYLDFGQVTPARSGMISVVIDARMSKPPICPNKDCAVTGGSMGVVEFSGFGDKTITMHYPAQIDLTSNGIVIGKICRMNIYSDATAQKVGAIQRVHIGGVLQTDQHISGQQITTSVPIDYSVQ